MPSQAKLGVIAYLGGCYKRAGEELRELKHGLINSGSRKKMKKEEEDGLEEMCGILEQIKDQVRVLRVDANIQKWLLFWEMLRATPL